MRIAISPRLATRTLENTATTRLFCLAVGNQLTVARMAAAPVIVALYVVDFSGHDYWATGLFAVAMATDWFDGRIARRTGRTSAMGSLLDPVADKVLVLAVLIVLVGRDVFPGWMVAAIVAREFLVSGLRLAALERGVVLSARDLGKLKTWTQSVAAIGAEWRRPAPGRTTSPGGGFLPPASLPGSQGSTMPASRQACCGTGPPPRSSSPDRHQTLPASSSPSACSTAASSAACTSSSPSAGCTSQFTATA